MAKSLIGTVLTFNGTVMHKGKLVNWNDEKGYGFIESDGLSENTFIHISTLKAMSRSPKAGDFIYFEVETQPNGKRRATNCRIEGVPSKQLKSKRHTNGSSLKLGKLLTGVMLVGIIVISVDLGKRFLPAEHAQPVYTETQYETEIETFQPVSINTQKFKCDGRQYCSQMTSREEAVFFIRNCPNTKMDGDGDGRPCENDSRF